VESPETLRWFSEVDAAGCLLRNSAKILSEAAKVGSSRFAAGVPVLDLERLVDLPKEPVSGTCRRTRVEAVPSALRGGSENAPNMSILGELTLGSTWRRVFVCHRRRRRAPHLEHCVRLVEACLRFKRVRWSRNGCRT
jgi:hypothetical protein